MAVVADSGDPVADLQALIPVFRQFCLDYPALARVMFSRPFEDFAPDLLNLPKRRQCATFCSPRCGGASIPANCVDAPTTLRTSSWRWRRALPSKRPAGGWAPHANPWTGGGAWVTSLIRGFYRTSGLILQVNHVENHDR